ncbi:MAG: tetratricopeptide repeat protein [Planctomycetaceae bacterium]|nr:tetratricopeptide repeat protein [Planctomycetaceae bacterium]
MKQILKRISAQNIRWQKAGLAGLLLCCAVGCQSMMPGSNSVAMHDPFSDGYQETASIDDIKGPMQRILQAGHDDQSKLLQSENSKGFIQYNSAQQLFDQGNYAAAEKAFDQIADDHSLDDSGFLRKRKWKDILKSRNELKAHYSDSPLREDSLFMLAESQYKQGELPGAETNYLNLLQEFPNTRHMDKATRRLFDIAMVWMDFKVTRTGDVALAAYTDNGPSSKPEVIKNKEYERPSFFNLTDKKRPFTDTQGRALEALKAIWLNDPTGDLADDALMLTASHYLRTGRYDEAAETYQLLRNEFQDSEHTKDAYVLGAYVSQASYQGAAYDGKNLTESRQLQMTALNIFPDMPAEEKKRLEQGLQKIDDAIVARDFNNAIVWLRKGEFKSVEMICYHIINTYPGSKYADKARGLLVKLPEYQTKNTLLLALDGVNADSIVPLKQLPPSLAPIPQPQIAKPKESKPPTRLPGYRLPPLNSIPVPNLLPSWSNDQPKEIDTEQNQPSSEENTSEPGRVSLTLGQE